VIHSVIDARHAVMSKPANGTAAALAVTIEDPKVPGIRKVRTLRKACQRRQSLSLSDRGAGRSRDRALTLSARLEPADAEQVVRRGDDCSGELRPT
jgi:hypothetical protein